MSHPALILQHAIAVHAGRLSGFRRVETSQDAVEVYATRRCRKCQAAGLFPAEFVDAEDNRVGLAVCESCGASETY